MRVVAVDLIDPDPGQPRREFEPDKLDALAESIRAEGVRQPLHVVQVGDRYRIKDGERRWRAARLAGRDVVPVMVQAPGTWLETRLHQFLTNALQEPLTPLEDAQALYLLWLGYQVEALEREQGDTSAANSRRLAADGSPVEQIAALSARLCELAGIPTLAAYARRDRVRVPWQRVLEACGRGDWSPDRRKRHLALLRVEPEVQEALAGVEVSGRTLRALAEYPPAVQRQLVEVTRGEVGATGLGAALRAALDRERGRGDVVAFRPRAELDEEDEDGAETTRGLVQAHRPAEVEDQGEPDDRAGLELTPTWSPEAVARLTVGLDALLGVLDEVDGGALDATARGRVLPLWAELVERLAWAGIEVATSRTVPADDRF